MKLSIFEPSQSQDAVALFTKVFSDSEGPSEGGSIGQLVSELISTTDEVDVVGFVAVQDEVLVGCIFFTRLTLTSQREVFMLSPVAIATKQQGKGLGQQLISFGIENLKSDGIEFVITYGDPNYYSKVGFRKVSEHMIKPPYKLSQPEGWLALSLQSGDIDMIKGEARCVSAFNRSEYW